VSDAEKEDWQPTEPWSVRWHKVDLFEAARHMQGRTLMPLDGIPHMNWPNDRVGFPEIVVFTDNTAVAVCSGLSSPVSPITPDLDIDPPSFWIGERAEEQRP
jgi:hypothetical protein